MHVTTRIAAAGLLLLTAGCMSDAVVFTTGTTIGVEVQGAEGGGNGARVGYQRQEFVSMPLRHEGGPGVRPAYPVLSLFSMETGGLQLSKLSEHHVRQVFATGAAATAPGALDSTAASFGALVGAELFSAESRDLARGLTDAIRRTPSDQRAAVTVIISETLGRGGDLSDSAHVIEMIRDRFEGVQETDALEDHADNTPDAMNSAQMLVDWAAEDNRAASMESALERVLGLIGEAP